MPGILFLSLYIVSHCNRGDLHSNYQAKNTAIAKFSYYKSNMRANHQYDAPFYSIWGACDLKK